MNIYLFTLDNFFEFPFDPLNSNVSHPIYCSFESGKILEYKISGKVLNTENHM